VITKDQATATVEGSTLRPYLHNNFHAPHPTRVGQCANWRRNGKTQTWKTRPDEFRIPVKFGLYAYDAITETNLYDASELYVEDECPRCHKDAPLTYKAGDVVIWTDGRPAVVQGYTSIKCRTVALKDEVSGMQFSAHERELHLEREN